MTDRLQKEASKIIREELADEEANDKVGYNNAARQKAKEKQSKLLMQAADAR